MELNENDLYVGVDVGTGSVRCAVVSSSGHVLSNAVQPILTSSPRPDFYQQSSDNIWDAICTTVKAAMKGRRSADVKGIGFDATCSLVLLDKDFKPLTVSPDGAPEQNIILWMDHRAKIEADKINSLKFDLLKFVGGKISIEMQPPKIMWLKRNLNKYWNKIGHIFDLPDFLTWKATGSLTRSLCSVVCKMMFQANEKEMNWDTEFWNALDLEEIVENGFEKIGQEIQAPGSECGKGLTGPAAAALGLPVGTPVGTSMIDAHVGGIGCLGCNAAEIADEFSSRLVMICGTSTCHMAVSKEAVFVPGVWGPYYSAMVPGLWLNEAGQSAAGALLDHIINTNSASLEFQQNLPKDTGLIYLFRHTQIALNEHLSDLALKRGASSVSRLTAELHTWPDFHGNRSPIADPTLKGMILGLTLSSNTENLALQYLSTLQALAYGTRHIIECMQACGHKIQSIVMCGGLSKNALYTQLHADITGLPVLLPMEEESVLLGASMLGAAAANGGNLQYAMKAMGGKAQVIIPNQEDQRYHEMKYKVFLSMLEFQKSVKECMQAFV